MLLRNKGIEVPECWIEKYNMPQMISINGIKRDCYGNTIAMI